VLSRGLALAGVGSGIWLGIILLAAHWASRAIDEGRLDRAESWLAVERRLSPWQDPIQASLARCLRRRNAIPAWQNLMDGWSRSAPRSIRLALERELMRIQAGGLEPDTQTQVNRLVESGADENDVIEAVVRGYLARHDSVQAERTLSAWNPGRGRVADSQFYAAILRQQQGDPVDSFQSLKLLLTRFPEHLLARQALGDQLLESHQAGAALTHFAMVARAIPDTPGAAAGLVRCLRELGQWTVAEEALSLISDPVERDWEAGELALERGDYSTAIRHFQAAGPRRTASSLARMSLATAWTLNGQSEQAQPLLTQDAREESLKKALRDVQVGLQLAPADFTLQRRLGDLRDALRKSASP